MDPKKVESARVSALKLKRLQEQQKKPEGAMKKLNEPSQASDLVDLDVPFITPGL
jgi:hypothetical protein